MGPSVTRTINRITKRKSRPRFIFGIIELKIDGRFCHDLISFNQVGSECLHMVKLIAHLCGWIFDGGAGSNLNRVIEHLNARLI